MTPLDNDSFYRVIFTEPHYRGSKEYMTRNLAIDFARAKEREGYKVTLLEIKIVTDWREAKEETP